MDPSYPVQVRARLDEPLSRWLWLVKWTYPLSQTPAAIRHVQEGRARGKVVITI